MEQTGNRYNLRPKRNRVTEEVKKPHYDSGFENVYQQRWNPSFFQGRKTIDGELFTAYAATALLCAQRLNYVCQQAKVPLPNPEAGVSNPIEKFPRRKSCKPKRPHSKRRKRKQIRNPTTGFFNVTKRKVYFHGTKKGNDGKVILAQAHSALLCAQRLNYRCKLAGLPLPNPEVGCVETIRTLPRTKRVAKRNPTTGFFNVSKGKDGFNGNKRRDDGKLIKATAFTALLCAQRLNYKCKLAGIPLPNPDIEAVKVKREAPRPGKQRVPKRNPITGFFNVSKYRSGFKGNKRANGKHIGCSAKTALLCAQRLNYKCELEGIPWPNPDIEPLELDEDEYEEANEDASEYADEGTNEISKKRKADDLEDSKDQKIAKKKKLD